MDLEKLDQIYSKITPFKNLWAEEKKKTDKSVLLKMLDFKTGGFRGIMREGLNGINDVTINILASELSQMCNSLVLGFDHRENSDRFAYIFGKIFTMKNKKIDVFRLCTTPYLAMESQLYDFGIMITASHNSKEYNGVKIYCSGSQISSEVAKKIKEKMLDCNFTEIYLRNENSSNFLDSDWRHELEKITIPTDFKKYFSNFRFNFQKTEHKITPIFSAMHGVSCPFIQEACNHFGMKINVASRYNRIDSSFADLKFPNPEIEENWRLLYKEMIPEQKDQNHFLFACDPDGDRFGMARVKNGELIIYNANTIAKIFLWYFLKTCSPEDMIMVNTFLCDDFFEMISKKHGIKYKKTATGFKNITKGIRELLEMDSKDFSIKEIRPYKKIVVAYEDPLGYILGTMKEKDGVIASVLMYHILQKYDLSDIFEELASYGTFNSYTVHLRLENPEEILKKVVESKSFEKVYDAFVLEEDEIELRLRLSGTESMIKIYAFSSRKGDEILRNEVDWWILKHILCYCRE